MPHEVLSQTRFPMGWMFGSFLLGLALATLTGWLWWQFASGEARISRTLNAPAVVREVQSLNELVTVKYTIQQVVGLEEQKQPFGTENILLFVQADVLAGVDLSQVAPTGVKVMPGRSVRLALPPPRIVHIIIDDKQTKVWDRRVTWWTPWVPYNQDLERQARVKALDMVEHAALEAGILDQARRNAETAVQGLLQTLGAKSVTVMRQAS